MMKLTLIRKDKKNQTHITHKDIEWLMAQIIGFAKGNPSYRHTIYQYVNCLL